MRRLTGVAALGAMLAGCPLPQPLPDYPPGAITPPRILVDGIPGSSQAVVLVPADCTGPEPSYSLSAQIYDTNTIEQVEARWFVNYDARFLEYYRWVQSDVIPPDPDPLVLTRMVPPEPPSGQGPFVFRPYQFRPPLDAPNPGGPPYTAPGTVWSVELVVSNGFDPEASDPPTPLPRRTPLPGFETQVHRWVFLAVPQSTAAVCP